jgi:hypothetical protein
VCLDLKRRLRRPPALAAPHHTTPHAGAEVDRVKREIEEVVGLDCSDALLASAKQGLGIPEILEAGETPPPPPGAPPDPLGSENRRISGWEQGFGNLPAAFAAAVPPARRPSFYIKSEQWRGGAVPPGWCCAWSSGPLMLSASPLAPPRLAPAPAAVVKKVPPPEDTRDRPLRALIFDSYYDSYKGVVVQVQGHRAKRSTVLSAASVAALSAAPTPSTAQHSIAQCRGSSCRSKGGQRSVQRSAQHSSPCRRATPSAQGHRTLISNPWAPIPSPAAVPRRGW